MQNANAKHCIHVFVVKVQIMMYSVSLSPYHGVRENIEKVIQKYTNLTAVQ